MGEGRGRGLKVKTERQQPENGIRRQQTARARHTETYVGCLMTATWQLVAKHLGGGLRVAVGPTTHIRKALELDKDTPPPPTPTPPPAPPTPPPPPTCTHATHQKPEQPPVDLVDIVQPTSPREDLPRRSGRATLAQCAAKHQQQLSACCRQPRCWRQSQEQHVLTHTTTTTTVVVVVVGGGVGARVKSVQGGSEARQQARGAAVASHAGEEDDCTGLREGAAVRVELGRARDVRQQQVHPGGGEDEAAQQRGGLLYHGTDVLIQREAEDGLNRRTDREGGRWREGGR